MIRGSVSSSAIASVELTLKGPGGQTCDVRLQVDTGFDGQLMLPSDTIWALNLTCVGYGIAHLADGSAIAVAHYIVDVLWDGNFQSSRNT